MAFALDGQGGATVNLRDRQLPRLRRGAALVTARDNPKETAVYLLISSTGNVGGQLVTLLREAGHGVRALVRDASRAERLPAGIDTAVGDLDDAESLEAAARGVDGIFFVERGTPAAMAAALRNLNELFRAGRAGVVAEDIRNLTGVAPRTFRAWCEQNAAALR